MKRAVVALALLPACSLVNRADLAAHVCGPEMSEDAVPICDVPACAVHVACYPRTQLLRDPSCPRAGPAGDVLIESDFTANAVDPVAWAWLVDGRSGVPAEVSGAGLLLTPRPSGTGAILTRDRFQLGTTGPVLLDVRLRINGLVAALDQFGQATVEATLATASPREPRLGWKLELTRRGGFARGVAARVLCRQRHILEPSLRAIDFDPSLAIDIRLEIGRDDLAAFLVAGTDAHELCRLPRPRGDGADELVLEIEAFRASASDPEVQLEWLRFARDARSPACEGLRGPLLAPRFCAGALEAAGLVVRTNARPASIDGRTLFLPVSAADGPRLAIARSADGRTGWRIETAPSAGAPAEVLAAVRDSAAGEDRAWGRSAAWTGTRLLAARDDGERTSWRTIAPIELDGVAPGGGFPAAVLERPEGYLAWYACADAEGFSAICTASSPDGISWRSFGRPVLGRGSPDAWDASGAGELGVAVSFTGQHYLMAYGSARAGAMAAIGLAVSRDGRSWSRHAMNPVVVGEDRGFDADGVVPIGVELAGRVTRIWYRGEHQSDRYRCRTDPASPSSDGGGIALAELVFAGAAGEITR